MQVRAQITRIPRVVGPRRYRRLRRSPKPSTLPGPPAPAAARRDVFGAMAGTVRSQEDIVEPLGEDDWEAAR